MTCEEVRKSDLSSSQENLTSHDHHRRAISARCSIASVSSTLIALINDKHNIYFLIAFDTPMNNSSDPGDFVTDN